MAKSAILETCQAISILVLVQQSLKHLDVSDLDVSHLDILNPGV